MHAEDGHQYLCVGHLYLCVSTPSRSLLPHRSYVKLNPASRWQSFVYPSLLVLSTNTSLHGHELCYIFSTLSAWFELSTVTPTGASALRQCPEAPCRSPECHKPLPCSQWCGKEEEEINTFWTVVPEVVSNLPSFPSSQE